MKKANNNKSGGIPRRDTNGHWLPGNSGNPKGRLKKDYCITSLIKEMLDQEADYIAPGVLPTDKTWRQMIARAMLIKCANGDVQMIKELLDRIDGKVPTAIDLGNKDDKPFVSRVIIEHSNNEEPFKQIIDS